MTQASQCDRLLAVLADGEWHTTASLYREAGGYIGALHSRIAELRDRRGLHIESESVPGRSGAEGHRYRLDAPEACCNTDPATLGGGGAPAPARVGCSAPSAEQPPQSSAPRMERDAGLTQSSGCLVAEQLTLQVAA